jgi:hypothetical protein
VRADQHLMMFLRVDIMTVVSVNAHLLISVFLFFLEKERTFYLQIEHNYEKVENQWTSILY